MQANAQIHTLDLQFKYPRAIAAFVVETDAGPVLIETGPHSVLPQLEKGLQNLGYTLTDIQQVLLSHIHFDHAGAAWALAEAGAQIYVHPAGWKHLQNPTRLYQSAQRIYGDQMQALWGDMKEIPEQKLTAVEDETVLSFGEKQFKAYHTPGHAKHHIAWQMGDIIFTGDIAGCRIDLGPVVPPCPPPDIDLNAWVDSIKRLRALNPQALYLTHFGRVEDVDSHWEALLAILQDWGDWMYPHWKAGHDPAAITPEFQAYAAAQLRAQGLNETQVATYEAANPAWMSVAGLMRYWEKKHQQA